MNGQLDGPSQPFTEEVCKLYWSDREGKKPPTNSTFRIRFFEGKDRVFSPQFIELPEPKIYKVLKKSYHPDLPNWTLLVEQALKRIGENEIEKVVLGRICTIELEEIPDPFAITAALQTNGAFLFCAQMKEESFLGATPERLFKRMGTTILSEAVAGTRSRSEDPKLDYEYGAELLLSSKDLKEFTPVQNYLQTVLEPICESLEFSPTSIHKTNQVQHLYSQCKGLVSKAVSDEEILSSLHPTPALCGTPSIKAKKLIEDLEPFKRHFFGGCLGVETEEESEWIVGIRSCHIKGKTVTLFSAAGIVDGSDPQKEWEELNQKIKQYDRILVN